MTTKFEKLFKSLICEASEAQNDYDTIMKSVLDEMKWKEEKRKAVEDLLYMYKKDKESLTAMKLKMEELFKNPEFAVKFSEIMEEFTKLNLDFNRYLSLQQNFNEMIENPNHENRRNFMFKVAKWLDKEDAKTVVALNQVEGKLRKLVRKYCEAE